MSERTARYLLDHAKVDETMAVALPVSQTANVVPLALNCAQAASYPLAQQRNHDVFSGDLLNQIGLIQT